MSAPVSLATRVGGLELTSAVMTAAGTAGYGDELAGYGDLADLGAVVSKSLASFAWPGNRAPRVAPAGLGMINAVGLAGPGVSAWRRDDLPRLLARGARVVASIWGRSVDEFHEAALAMAGAEVIAVEINASCPNLEARSAIFAHSAEQTAAVIEAAAVMNRPRWVKLSPNTPDLVHIAGAALDAGADALVVANTVIGLSIDVESGRASLGHGGGGVSGPVILPVALRAVYDCRAAYPDAPIVGVGGISSAQDAIAMLMAGANAVEIGTASFADPRAPWRIQRAMRRWMRHHHESTLVDIIGRSHG